MSKISEILKQYPEQACTEIVQKAVKQFQAEEEKRQIEEVLNALEIMEENTRSAVHKLRMYRKLKKLAKANVQMLNAAKEKYIQDADLEAYKESLGNLHYQVV
jgi:predicted naringenin-chalcone synthase